MKTICSFITFVSLFLPVTLLAETIKIPKTVFKVGQLEEAKKQALEKKKPLVFLYTFETSN